MANCHAVKAMAISLKSMLQLLQQLPLFHLGYVDYIYELYNHECFVAAEQRQLVLFWHR